MSSDPRAWRTPHVLWTATLRDRRAQLDMLRLAIGFDLRLFVDEELVRTELFPDGHALIEAATTWRTMMEGKGWLVTVPGAPPGR